MKLDEYRLKKIIPIFSNKNVGWIQYYINIFLKKTYQLYYNNNYTDLEI